MLNFESVSNEEFQFGGKDEPSKVMKIVASCPNCKVPILLENSKSPIMKNRIEEFYLLIQ